jgi:hypothetical protein
LRETLLVVVIYPSSHVVGGLITLPTPQHQRRRAFFWKNTNVGRKTLKCLQDIQKLNEQDRSTVLEMVDAFLRDRKTKKHYAE